ncbi:MAG: L28 family ribosomal protein [bacterium]|nr:L28 family ribosomal protein [bacterium]
MAYKCENCKKGMIVGRQHKHHPGVAGGRWKRRAPKTTKIFKPNLHMARVTIDGFSKRMKLCSKCIRLLKGKSTRDVKKQKEAVQPQNQVQTAL